MDNDPKHRIRGYTYFGKMPGARQGLVIAILFIVLMLIGIFLQQTGLWPEGWSSTFDGTGE